METLKIIEMLVVMITLVLLVLFVLLSSRRKGIALAVSISYLMGSPFDLIYGRTFAFYLSLLLSLLYLQVYMVARRRKEENK